MRAMGFWLARAVVRLQPVPVTVDNPQRVVVGTGAAAGLRPVPVTLGLSRSVLPHRWQ